MNLPTKQRCRLTVNGRTIEYSLRTSGRARRVRVQVSPRDGVAVIVPRGLGARTAEAFLARVSEWVFRAEARAARTRALVPVGGNRRDYEARKAEALAFLRGRVEALNAHYRVPVRRVGIRNQRVRWGSCSRSGALSLNYRLLLLPPRLADYVVAHELCHLLAFDHSPRFWSLVAETIPDYRARRAELRGYLISHR